MNKRLLSPSDADVDVDATTSKRPARRVALPDGIDDARLRVARSPSGHYGLAVALDVDAPRAWAWRAGAGRPVPLEGIPAARGPASSAVVSVRPIVDDEGNVAIVYAVEALLVFEYADPLVVVGRIPSSGAASIPVRRAEGLVAHPFECVHRVDAADGGIFLPSKAPSASADGARGAYVFRGEARPVLGPTPARGAPAPAWSCSASGERLLELVGGRAIPHRFDGRAYVPVDAPDAGGPPGARPRALARDPAPRHGTAGFPVLWDGSIAV